MKPIFTFILIVLSINLFSQTQPVIEQPEQRNCATIGFLEGGGALLGADIEFLLTDQLGFQIGAGLVGFGGGINYHLKPSIRSSFLTLQYWNQGVGDSFTQNVVGASYVFRGKKWLTFQLGLGAPLSKGPAMAADFVQPPVMLMYAIGAYFPF